MKPYQNFSADLLKPVLVGEALELRAQSYELRVLLLQMPLLLHNSRDLLGHHLGHLVAHVGLQHVQE
jgi:hypothetical protein